MNPVLTSRLIRFNKPYGVLSQFTAEGRWRGLKDFIDIPDVYVAGRLDADSEGLLLLTNDGRLQARIADPRFKMEKIYWVQVEGVPDEPALEALRHGVQLNDGLTRSARAQVMAPPTLWERTPPVRVRHRMDRAGDFRGPQPPGAAHDGGSGFAHSAADPRRHWPAHTGRPGSRHIRMCQRGIKLTPGLKIEPHKALHKESF
jgi:23S rRNA pseudouridine2457 synthase